MSMQPPCASKALPSQAKLAIFDLDGTLIDSFPDIRSSIAVALDTIGLVGNDEIFSLVKRGVGLQVFFEQATQSSIDDQPKRYASFVDSYRSDYRENSINKAFAGSDSFLRELKERRPGLLLGIATAKPTSMAKSVLAQAKLDHYFDHIYGTDELPHKPNPALLHRVCERAQIAKSDSIMVGDTDRDIGAAQRAPMTAVAITHGGWSRNDLAELSPCHIVDNYSELLALMS